MKRSHVVMCHHLLAAILILGVTMAFIVIQPIWFGPAILIQAVLYLLLLISHARGVQ